MGTFHLYNRDEDSTTTVASSVTRTRDEDAKELLDTIARELKKMNLHLYSITDEELLEE